MRYSNILHSKFYLLVSVLSISIVGILFAETDGNLVLYGEDVRIEENYNLGGFFLYVKKRDEINSILLTESAQDNINDTKYYAFRAPSFNGINGNEKRVYNGNFIQSKTGFFIVDSSPEPDELFGSAFVLFIPYKIEYGYRDSDTRYGVRNLENRGIYMNVRTFELRYADYSGDYEDNNFYLENASSYSGASNATVNSEPSVKNFSAPNQFPAFSPIEEPAQNAPINPASAPQYLSDVENMSVAEPPPKLIKTPATSVVENIAAPTPTPSPVVENIPIPAPTPVASSIGSKAGVNSIVQSIYSEKYDINTVASFTNIGQRGNTGAVYVEDKNDIADKISAILAAMPRGKSTDVVILLDITRSMWDDLAVLKSRLIPSISRILSNEVYRIGMVLYRDTDIETNIIGFTDQLDEMQRKLNALQASGGGDWPEAVYEAMSAGVNKYKWIAENRVMFIVGDAPPHEPPNTQVNLDDLYRIAHSKNILMYPLIVPKR